MYIHTYTHIDTHINYISTLTWIVLKEIHGNSNILGMVKGDTMSLAAVSACHLPCIMISSHKNWQWLVARTKIAKSLSSKMEAPEICFAFCSGLSSSICWKLSLLICKRTKVTRFPKDTRQVLTGGLQPSRKNLATSMAVLWTRGLNGVDMLILKAALGQVNRLENPSGTIAGRQWHLSRFGAYHLRRRTAIKPGQGAWLRRQVPHKGHNQRSWKRWSKLGAPILDGWLQEKENDRHIWHILGFD